MRKTIRFIAVLILVLGIVASVFTVYAMSIPSATNDFYVNDFAGIFSEGEKKELLEKAVNLADTKDGIQVVVTTVQSLDGNSIENYAVEMYNQYGIGKNDMGVLILLSTGDRQIRVEVGYAMEAYITDAKAGKLIDEYAIPYLRDNNFSEGLISLQAAVISEITNQLESEAITRTNTLPSNSEEVSSPIVTRTDSADNNESYVGLVALVLILVLFAVLFIRWFVSVILQNRKLKLEIEQRNLDFEEAKQKLKNAHQEEIEMYRHSNAENTNQYVSRMHELTATHNAKVQDLSSEIRDLKVSLMKSEEKHATLLEEHSSLQEYCERAKRLHPNLDNEISDMIAKEEEEKNRKAAAEFDSFAKELLGLTANKGLLYRFDEALTRYHRLTDAQKAYVKSDISKLTSLHRASAKLQEEYEKQQEIERDKLNAQSTQESISNVLSAISRGTASSLSRLRAAYRSYTGLNSSAQNYVDSSVIVDLKTLLDDAERDQQRIEEEERRRREREEAERRRREREEAERREAERRRREQEEAERRRREQEEEDRRRRQREEEERRRRSQSSYGSSSFGSSSHFGGFGGHSGGGGATRGF